MAAFHLFHSELITSESLTGWCDIVWNGWASQFSSSSLLCGWYITFFLSKMSLLRLFIRVKLLWNEWFASPWIKPSVTIHVFVILLFLYIISSYYNLKPNIFTHKMIRVCCFSSVNHLPNQETSSPSVHTRKYCSDFHIIMSMGKIYSHTPSSWQ